MSHTKLLSRRTIGLTIVAVLCGTMALFGPSWYVRFQLRQARQALEARDEQRALHHLQAIASLSSEHPERHFLLARTYRRLGRMNQVRRHIQRAWEFGHPVKPLQREQWLALAQGGQFNEAERHLGQLLQQPGEDGPEICEAFVNGYFLTYRFSQAFAILDAWQADYPQDPQPYVFRGLYWEHANQPAKAIAAFQEALQRASGRTDVRFRLAQSLIKLHRYEKAHTQLELCLKQKPHDPDILAAWARNLMEQGKQSSARQILEKLLRKNPDHFIARWGMGRIELSAGNPERALQWLRPLLIEQPHDTSVHYALGSTYRTMGDIEAAEKHMTFVDEAQQALAEVRKLMDAVLEDPEDVELRHKIGALLLQYGPPDQGAAWLRSALTLDPNRPDTQQLLAQYQSESPSDSPPPAKHSLLPYDHK